jgi:Flp pilus assembly protein TadG
MIGLTLRSRRGSAMVELSIASLIFFFVIFGTIGFGHAIYRYNTVSNAARSAVRWAIVRGSSSGQTAVTASQVHDYIVTQMNGITETDTVTWIPDTKPGSTVQVVVRASYTISIPRMTTFSVPLRSRARMVIVR